MRAEDLRAYAQRDWSAAARAGQAHWREQRARLGPAEGLRLAAELAATVRALRPDWPSAAERAEDLEMHLRVSEALRRVGAG